MQRYSVLNPYLTTVEFSLFSKFKKGIWETALVKSNSILSFHELGGRRNQLINACDLTNETGPYALISYLVMVGFS